MAATQSIPILPTPVIHSDQLKGSLPNVDIDETVDCTAIATTCIARLENLQQSSLTPDALWRDSLSITGHQRTFNSAFSVSTAWNELALKCKPHNFQLVPHTAQVFKLGPKPVWLSAVFQFETEGEQAANCSGMLNMVPDESGDYKIWVIGTMMEALKDVDGEGNPDSFPDPSFAPAANLDDGGEIDCVVVGGGMAGLSVAGRLHTLRGPYVVVERNDTVGDNWTKRYDSVRLHLSNTYSEMPFQRVYTDKPFNLGSQDLADGMKKYVSLHNIQVWLSSSVDQARWDEASRSWNVTILRQGQPKTLKARHLIMATGGGVDKAYSPEYANRSSFKGNVMHSVGWRNAEGLAGKKAVIVGSGNSAFDIAVDMTKSGVKDITMLQRGVTHVMSTSVLYPLQDALYNPNMDVGMADRIVMTPPYAVGRLMVMAGASALQAQEEHRYDFLKKAGFRYHQSPDLFANPIEKLGGHVLDHGALSLIENGQVKVRSGILPTAYTEKGLRLADDTELEADIIILATGYRNSLHKTVSEIVGPETAARLDEFWGLDAEGELRGLAKPLNHPGIWYHGGGTAHARFVSRFLALQIKADLRGTPFLPYTATP